MLYINKISNSLVSIKWDKTDSDFSTYETRFTAIAIADTNSVEIKWYSGKGRSFVEKADQIIIDGVTQVDANNAVNVLNALPIGYLINEGGSSGGGTCVCTWGQIQGDIKDQLDLQTILDSLNTGGGTVNATWGSIQGTLTAQSDLAQELDTKLVKSNNDNIAYVAFDGGLVNAQDICINQSVDANANITVPGNPTTNFTISPPFPVSDWTKLTIMVDFKDMDNMMLINSFANYDSSSGNYVTYSGNAVSNENSNKYIKYEIKINTTNNTGTLTVNFVSSQFANQPNLSNINVQIPYIDCSQSFVQKLNYSSAVTTNQDAVILALNPDNSWGRIAIKDLVDISSFVKNIVSNMNYYTGQREDITPGQDMAYIVMNGKLYKPDDVCFPLDAEKLLYSNMADLTEWWSSKTFRWEGFNLISYLKNVEFIKVWQSDASATDNNFIIFDKKVMLGLDRWDFYADGQPYPLIISNISPYDNTGMSGSFIGNNMDYTAAVKLIVGVNKSDCDQTFVQKGTWKVAHISDGYDVNLLGVGNNPTSGNYNQFAVVNTNTLQKRSYTPNSGNPGYYHPTNPNEAGDIIIQTTNGLPSDEMIAIYQSNGTEWTLMNLAGNFVISLFNSIINNGQNFFYWSGVNEVNNINIEPLYGIFNGNHTIKAQFDANDIGGVPYKLNLNQVYKLDKVDFNNSNYTIAQLSMANLDYDWNFGNIALERLNVSYDNTIKAQQSSITLHDIVVNDFYLMAYYGMKSITLKNIKYSSAASSKYGYALQTQIFKDITVDNVDFNNLNINTQQDNGNTLNIQYPDVSATILNNGNDIDSNGCSYGINLGIINITNTVTFKFEGNKKIITFSLYLNGKNIGTLDIGQNGGSPNNFSKCENFTIDATNLVNTISEANGDLFINAIIAQGFGTAANSYIYLINFPISQTVINALKAKSVTVYINGVQA